MGNSDTSYGVYLIAESGLCFKSVKNTGLENDLKENDDLIAPFLTGIDLCLTNAFKNYSLNSINMEDYDGRKIKICFKNYTIDKIYNFKVVLVSKGMVDNVDLGSKMTQLYFLIKSNEWYKKINKNILSANLSSIIKTKIDIVFNNK